MTREPTVFVVDDDPGVRRSLAALGRAHGLNVEGHASAESFLAAYEPTRAGCVLLDVRLGRGRSGLELQETLRRLGRALPIVVISGHADVATSVRAFRQGALDFLEKPVRPRVLLRRILDALALDRRQRDAAARRAGVAARLARLTPRERQVARLMVAGKRSKEVAVQLGMSPRTAEGHRRQVLRKMAVGSTAELTTAWMTQRPGRR